MSLIIAIEPDRDQAAQLKDLVRRHTGAELILTETTERAITAIEQRVPDLVLIPALMSPEDDEALTTALRVAEDAKHVQTLTIPVLGAPQAKSLPGGVLSRLRGQSRPAAPDSCDPRLFAEQITEYLERIAKDRAHLPAANGNGSLGPQTSSHTGSSQPSPTSQSGAHTSSQGSRKVKAAAAQTAAPKSQPAAEKAPPVAEPPRMVAPAPKPAPEAHAAPKAPAPNHPDVSELEAALSQVSLDEPEPAIARAPAQEGAQSTAESEALEMGLSSLLDRLGNEDWSDEPVAIEPAKPKPVAAPPPAAAAPPPRAVVAAAPPDPAQWAELKQLESIEYAMPKIVPQDAPEVEPPKPPPTPPVQAAAPKPAAPPPPAPSASPAPKQSSEWGDLLDSLKKDLGK